MKKILFGLLLVIFSITLGCFTMLEFKIGLIKKESINLENDIKQLSNNYDILKEENLKYEEEINTLKEEKKELIKEDEIWKEMKEKIEKALS